MTYVVVVWSQFAHCEVAAVFGPFAFETVANRYAAEFRAQGQGAVVERLYAVGEVPDRVANRVANVQTKGGKV